MGAQRSGYNTASFELFTVLFKRLHTSLIYSPGKRTFPSKKVHDLYLCCGQNFDAFGEKSTANSKKKRY